MEPIQYDFSEVIININKLKKKLMWYPENKEEMEKFSREIKPLIKKLDYNDKRDSFKKLIEVFNNSYYLKYCSTFRKWKGTERKGISKSTPIKEAVHLLPNSIFSRKHYIEPNIQLQIIKTYKPTIMANRVHEYHLIIHFLKKYAATNRSVRLFAINGETKYFDGSYQSPLYHKINELKELIRENYIFTTKVEHLAKESEIEANRDAEFNEYFENYVCTSIECALLCDKSKEMTCIRLMIAATKLCKAFATKKRIHTFLAAIKKIINANKYLALFSINKVLEDSITTQRVHEFIESTLEIISICLCSLSKKPSNDGVNSMAINIIINVFEKFESTTTSMSLASEFPLTQILDNNTVFFITQSFADNVYGKIFKGDQNFQEILASLLNKMSLRSETFAIASIKYIISIISPQRKYKENVRKDILLGNLFTLLNSTIINLSKKSISNYALALKINSLIDAIGYNIMFECKDLSPQKYNKESIKNLLSYLENSDRCTTISDKFRHVITKDIDSYWDARLQEFMKLILNNTKNKNIIEMMNKLHMVYGYFSFSPFFIYAFYHFIKDGEYKFDDFNSFLTHNLPKSEEINSLIGKAWLDAYMLIIEKSSKINPKSTSESSQNCKEFIKKLKKDDQISQRLECIAKYYHYNKFLLRNEVKKLYNEKNKTKKTKANAIYYEFQASPMCFMNAKVDILKRYKDIENSYLTSLHSEISLSQSSTKDRMKILMEDLYSLNFSALQERKEEYHKHFTSSQLNRLQIFEGSSALEEWIVRLFMEYISEADNDFLKDALFRVNSQLIYLYGISSQERWPEIILFIQSIRRLWEWIKSKYDGKYIRAKWEKSQISPRYWHAGVRMHYTIKLAILNFIPCKDSAEFMPRVQLDFIKTLIKFSNEGTKEEVWAIFNDTKITTLEGYYYKMKGINKLDLNFSRDEIWDKFMIYCDKKDLTPSDARYFCKLSVAYFKALIEIKYIDNKIFSTFRGKVQKIDEGAAIMGHKTEKYYLHLANFFEKQISSSKDNAIYYIEFAAFNYLKAAKEGHRFIWHTLPLGLQLWDKFYDQNPSPSKNERFVKIFKEIELYKIASNIDIILLQAKICFSKHKKSSSGKDPIIFPLLEGRILELLNKYPYQGAWIVKRMLLEQDLKDLYAHISSNFSVELSKSSESLNKFFDSVCAQIIFIKEKRKDAEKKIIKCDGKVLLPTHEYLSPNLNEAAIYHQDPQFAESLYCTTIIIMPSKEKPVRVSIKTNKGNDVYFLIKTQSNASAIESQFIRILNIINEIFASNKECKMQRLKARIYEINFLNSQNIIVEWITNTSTLRSIIFDEMKSKATPVLDPKFFDKSNCISAWESVKNNKPVLQKWYRKLHKSSDEWYQTRLNYIRSMSVWSVIGDFIDLGDRHLENILVDKNSGEVVHIDFELLFGQGRKLGVPEIIPFRLSNNLISALDTLEDEGAFFSIAVSALKALCANAKSLYMYLQIFDKPKLNSSQANKAFSCFLDFKNEFLTRMEKISINIPGHWMEMVKAARSEDNLKQLFVGWAPWV